MGMSMTALSYSEKRGRPSVSPFFLQCPGVAGAGLVAVLQGRLTARLLAGREKSTGV